MRSSRLLFPWCNNLNLKRHPIRGSQFIPLDLLEECDTLKLNGVVVQAFYNGITHSVQSTIDAAACDTLMNKTQEEAYNLIEEMVVNNYQWSNKRGQPKRVRGKLKVNAVTLLSAKVDAMTQRLGHLNVNVVGSNAPSPSCEICGSVDHLTTNCQVRRPFAQDNSNQVNYVNNYNLRLINDPSSNIYNPG